MNFHPDFRSNRERWTMAMVSSFSGVGIAVTYDVFEYSLVWLVALTAVGCVSGSLSWLAWKRWGRVAVPLKSSDA